MFRTKKEPIISNAESRLELGFNDSGLSHNGNHDYIASSSSWADSIFLGNEGNREGGGWMGTFKFPSRP